MSLKIIEENKPFRFLEGLFIVVISLNLIRQSYPNSS